MKKRHVVLVIRTYRNGSYSISALRNDMMQSPAKSCFIIAKQTFLS